MSFPRDFVRFVKGSVLEVARGSRAYYTWNALLFIMLAVGLHAYAQQYSQGLVITALRDQTSWGFYIGNFTFLVGVAAAAIMLVIPAYIYNWGPIREIVVLGELLAISAVVMCLLFVTADLGRPDRALHLMVALNFPRSLLAWDVVVLNLYFILNLVIVTHLVYKAYYHRHYNKKIIWPLIIISIPAAVSIHTVTAFIYSGLAARPFWNHAILAPRFLVSAFCSGPAVLLITLQVVRKLGHVDLKDSAFRKVAELMAYAMFMNLFFFGAEVFTEFYAHTHHLVHSQFALFGFDGKTTVANSMWLAIACNVSAFLIFLVPRTRNYFPTMNLGCVLIFTGVYIEKGMGLVAPGFVPDVLGEAYDYVPSSVEWRVGIGVFAAGALLYTWMVKVAVAVVVGRMQGQPAPAEGDSHAADPAPTPA